MPTFACEKTPGLLVIGAGQFKNGTLTVEDQEKVKKVRAIAKRFGITEGGSPEPEATTEVSKGNPDKEPEEGTEEKPATEASEAQDAPAELDPPEPASSAKRAELDEWAKAHAEKSGNFTEDDLQGKNAAQVREYVREHGNYA